MTLNKATKVILSTDYDADGILSAVIGIKCFKHCSIPFEHIILNNKYPRGVSKHTIDMTLEKTDNNESFIFLTADHGSSSVDALVYLREQRKNVYIVVTDHHIIPDEEALEEVCDEIYNPYYSKCNYDKGLSGAGVLREYLEEKIGDDYIERLTQYVVVANLVDQMPMTGRNVPLYHHYVDELKEDIFIKHMLKVSRKKRVHDRWISINLGPLINSSHRLGRPEVAVRALLGHKQSMCELDLLNKERKKMTTELIDFIKPQLRANKSLDTMSIIVMPSDAMSSLAGLVAGRIGNDLNKPTFVLKNKDGYLNGSARAIQQLPLLDIYKYINDNAPGTIGHYGGHNMANGVSIKYTNDAIDNFITLFSKYLEEHNIEYSDSVESSKIDACDIMEEVAWIEENRPFGNSNPYPTYEIQDLEVMKVHYYPSMTKVAVTDGKQEFTVLYFKKNEIDESLPIIVTGTLEIDKDIVIIANSIRQ
jgi:single-stranded-DNA-specific exonuclease